MAWLDMCAEVGDMYVAALVQRGEFPGGVCLRAQCSGRVLSACACGRAWINRLQPGSERSCQLQAPGMRVAPERAERPT